MVSEEASCVSTGRGVGGMPTWRAMGAAGRQNQAKEDCRMKEDLDSGNYDK